MTQKDKEEVCFIFLNEYSKLVDVKSGRFNYQSGRDRETRQKSVSLPPKAGELASKYLCGAAL